MRTLPWALVILLALALLPACTSMPDRPHTIAPPQFDGGAVRTAHWALVLSGGSMRGFAHVGALKALAAEGLVPDLIVGVSAGAIVGSIAASGGAPDAMEAAAAAIRPEFPASFSLPFTGLLGGTQIHAVVDAHAKRHRIEEFPIRFAVAAVEAERACLQVFNLGDAGLAVQASATVPVVLTPPDIDSRRYLDGALISPLPVRLAYALGAERVVAVDVTFDPSERHFHSIFDAFWRTNLVMSRTLATVEAAEADVLAEPILPPEREISIARRATLIEAGERAMRAEMPRIRELLNAPPAPRGVAGNKTLAKLLCPEVTRALGFTIGKQL